MAKSKRKGDGAGRPLDDYAVGYGRPPVAHQFRAGERSRNPNGRRGKARPVASPEIEPDFLDGLVVISIDGERRQVTREEAVDHALYVAAMKGSVSAARELEARRSLREQRRAAAARGLATQQADGPVSAEDEQLIAGALRRAGQHGYSESGGSAEGMNSDDEAGDA